MLQRMTALAVVPYGLWTQALSLGSSQGTSVPQQGPKMSMRVCSRTRVPAACFRLGVGSSIGVSTSRRIDPTARARVGSAGPQVLEDER